MQDPVSHSSAPAAPAIFWAGFVCGILDIAAAFAAWGYKGVAPTRVLQGIATSVLGKASFDGGWGTAALGLGLHFLIAYGAATVFYCASRGIAFLTLHPFLSGPLFGVAVYLVMYWIVVPLSRSKPGPFSWTSTIIAVVTHIVCVGTPIALIVRHYSR